MNVASISFVDRFIDQASFIYDNPFLFTTLVLLFKLTLLLGLAWLVHFWIGEKNPFWRQLMWRTTAVGLIVLLLMTSFPPLMTLNVLPIKDRTIQTDSTARLPLTIPAKSEKNASTITEDSIQSVTAKRNIKSNLHSKLDAAVPSTPPNKLAASIDSPAQIPKAKPQTRSERPARQSLRNGIQKTKEAIFGWFSLSSLSISIWLTGCVFVLIRTTAGWLFLHGIKRKSNPISKTLTQMAHGIADEMNLKQCPVVRCSSKIDMPCLSGLFNPVILLPTAIVKRPGKADIASVIAHECAHLERNDLIWNACLQVITTWLWFHPLAWRARLAHVDSCDSIVDARVAGHFNNRERYCQTLALLALRAKSLAPVISLGMARKSTVHKRIERLKRGLPDCQLSTRKSTAFVGYSMVVVVLFGSLSISRVIAAPITKPTPTASHLSTFDANENKNPDELTAISSQHLLPESTQFWLSIPDAARLNRNFLTTQLGQLTQKEELAAFIDSFVRQLPGLLNEENFRLGLTIDDILNVPSGEICVAGVSNHLLLPDAIQNARGSHGLVVLADVSGNLADATEMMSRISKRLINSGATKENFSDIPNALVYKWKFPEQRLKKHSQYAFHAIANGWFLSSNNETIFRKMLQKSKNVGNAINKSTLASKPSFQRVMTKIELHGFKSEANWFLDPVGCIQLGQALERERRVFIPKNDNDWARFLEEIGFDGFAGIGGSLTFATNEHEVLHRTFVAKSVPAERNSNQEHVFEMLNFKNTEQSPLMPPAFIKDEAAGYFCASWDMQRALKNAGHLFDLFTRQKGAFNKTLESLLREMKVDIPKVIKQFGNEIMVISDSAIRGEDGDERIMIAIQMNGNSDFVIDNIKKSWPYQHKLSRFQDTTIVAIENTTDGSQHLVRWEDDPFRVPPKEKLEETYVAITKDYLLIANDMKYLKGVLQSNHEMPISKSDDYKRIANSLNKIADVKNISFRQFSRLDRVIRQNYDLMRNGKMADGKTILTRLINYLLEPNDDVPLIQKRDQKIDGSQLPANYDLHVAPFLGPSGWVMEPTNDGWLFTGVVLNRQ